MLVVSRTLVAAWQRGSKKSDGTDPSYNKTTLKQFSAGWKFLSRWVLELQDELRWHTGPHCRPLLVLIVSVSLWDNKIPACLK